MAQGIHSGVRELVATDDGEWDMTLDNRTTVHITGEQAKPISMTWVDHEVTLIMEGDQVMLAVRGVMLAPLCRCCSGTGRHAYRAFPIGMPSPDDDDEECTACAETGRSYHHVRPDSCGGAKALRRGRRAV